MIETLGVPPTEVDLIMVNGVPEDFTYRLANAGVSRARHRTLRAGLWVENDYGEKRSSEHSVHSRMFNAPRDQK
jgi:hypothetical protein